MGEGLLILSRSYKHTSEKKKRNKKRGGGKRQRKLKKLIGEKESC